MSEEIDNQTERYPQVGFLDDGSEFWANAGSIVSTGDGKNWTASLDVSQLPEDKENFLGVRIIVYDEVGNLNDIVIPDTEIRDNVTFNPTRYRLRFDTKAPVLSGLSLATTNTGITDTDRPSVLLATTGDTLTLSFETSERIATPDDGALAPDVEIHDQDGNKIGTGIVSVQSSDAGTEKLWKAEFTVPDDEAFTNYEMDFGFQISVKDPSGNQRQIGFDEAGTLIDATGTQTTQAPSNKVRIDTKDPEVTLVSLETTNDGLSDQDRTTHLLARDGDNLTLYFRTSERIAGVDETLTNVPLKPIVIFQSESGDNFTAVVSKDTLTEGSGTDESLHKGLHWKAVLRINPAADANLADLESDLRFSVKIRDPSGNEYSASNSAASMPKPKNAQEQF
jgi:hypothetical protein